MKEEDKTVITGIRPTGNLTIANFAGAVRPLLDIQEKYKNIYVFVADLHALTDNEPSSVLKNRLEVAKDYLALGVDPHKVSLYLQSDTEDYVSSLTLRLSRLISIAELIRLPTLKEKIKNNANPETSNSLLALYPVLMAADIFLQRAAIVPVGEDQIAHIEVARKLASRFNSTYGETIVTPQSYLLKPIKILSLKGEGKMSKSSPEGAIFLTDDPEVAARKIKRAQSADPGVLTTSVESLFSIAKSICNEEETIVFEKYKQRHIAGESVMGEFKNALAEKVASFLRTFQKKRSTLDDALVKEILQQGANKARSNADSFVNDIKKAMQF